MEVEPPDNKRRVRRGKAGTARQMRSARPRIRSPCRRMIKIKMKMKIGEIRKAEGEKRKREIWKLR